MAAHGARAESARSAESTESGPSVGSGESTSAIRGLLAALADALTTRLDLAAVELEIHLHSMMQALLWIGAAVGCALLAFTCAVASLIVMLWDTHRLVGLLAGTAAFVLLAAVFAFLGLRALRAQPAVLEGSLEELREDQRSVLGE